MRRIWRAWAPPPSATRKLPLKSRLWSRGPCIRITDSQSLHPAQIIHLCRRCLDAIPASLAALNGGDARFAQVEGGFTQRERACLGRGDGSRTSRLVRLPPVRRPGGLCNSPPRSPALLRFRRGRARGPLSVLGLDPAIGPCGAQHPNRRRLPRLTLVVRAVRIRLSGAGNFRYST